VLLLQRLLHEEQICSILALLSADGERHVHRDAQSSYGCGRSAGPGARRCDAVEGGVNYRRPVKEFQPY
jgi:hypothetical protein